MLVCEWWQRNGEFTDICIKDRRKKHFMASKHYFILIFSAKNNRPKNWINLHNEQLNGWHFLLNTIREAAMVQVTSMEWKEEKCIHAFRGELTTWKNEKTLRILRYKWNNNMNPLTPNDDYSSRTALLNPKSCILYIYSTHIGTEYFKRGSNSPFFPLQNAVCFINLTYLVSVLFTFNLQDVLK